MKNLKDIKYLSETVIVGCDHSKNTNWLYFTQTGVAESRVFKIANNRKDFKKLKKKVLKFKEKNKAKRIIFVSEATGNYGMPLINFMHQLGAGIKLVNPKHTKRMRECTDNSPNKTDKKDPKVIAHAVLHHYLEYLPPSSDEVATLRELVRTREEKVTILNQQINRAESKLARYFPEYIQVMNGVQSKTAKLILKEYPTPELLADCNVTELGERMYHISRGKLGHKRAEKLITAARQTVGLSQGQVALEDIMPEEMAMILTTEGQIKKLEASIQTILDQTDVGYYLSSIKGLGTITVATIIAEVRDFNAFDSIDKLLKYAGVNIFEVSSGKVKGIKRITKRGSGLLRKALYFATLNTIREGGIFYGHYQAHLAKGMPGMKAITAISRKILRIAYGLAKNQQTFDIEKLKQQEMKQKSQAA